METLQKPRAGSRRTVHQDQTQAAPLGHNASPIDQEGFLSWMSKIKQHNAVVALHKKQRDKVRKLAKNAGVELAIMDRIIKEEDQDPDTILRWMKTYREYSEWAQNPVGTQLSMFDLPNSSLLSHKEREDKARRAGYTLGLLGKDADKQAYPVDHEFHQAHMGGWMDAQRVLGERLKPIDDAINSSDVKPEPDADEAEEKEEAEA